jgi:hypothetical protein
LVTPRLCNQPGHILFGKAKCLGPRLPIGKDFLPRAVVHVAIQRFAHQVAWSTLLLFSRSVDLPQHGGGHEAIGIDVGVHLIYVAAFAQKRKQSDWPGQAFYRARRTV